MIFCLPFVTLIVTLAALGTPVEHDAATIVSDIQKMDTRSQSLDNDINALPSTGNGVTITQVYAVHEGAGNLSSLLQTATEHATASSALTDQEADTILTPLKNSFLLVLRALNDLVAKRSAISAVNGAGIAKLDLKTLKGNTDAFGTALMAKFPADKKSDVQAQMNAADSAFTSAINAF